MWGAIKQVLPGTKKSTVSSIFENGKWHTEIFSVAKIMNQYFVSVGRVLAKPFQNVSTVFTSSTLPIEFHLDNVNMNFVRNALKSFKPNKAVGLDKLIKCSFVEGCFWRHRPILTGLINKSFTDGVFPGVWKCAKVTALFKDGDKSLKDNYRPISILPTISKIRSAHIQLSSNFGRNHIIITITVWLPTKAFNFHYLNRLCRSSPRKYGQRMCDGNNVRRPSQGVWHCWSSALHQQAQVTRSSREKFGMVPLIALWSSSTNDVC